MGDLEQIHGIEAGVQALVTFIICAAVKHFIIDDNIIITKKNFTNQCKIRLLFLGITTEPAHEIVIQTVSDIQPEPVDVKSIDPEFYTFQKIIDDCRVLQI